MTKKLRSLIGMLVAIFLLGMATNLIGTPEKGAAVAYNVFSGIVLALHVLTAIGILVVATQVARLAAKAPTPYNALLGRGFAALGVAFLAGVATMAVSSPWNEITSFIMALGFIGALILYGMAFARLSKR